MTEHMGKRLAKAMLNKGVDKNAVAKEFGVKVPSVYDWLEHGRIAKKHIPKLQEYFGGSLDWWLGLSELHETGNESFEIDLENNPDYPSVRRVTFKLSAGTSGFGVDYDDKIDAAPIVFSKDWYAKRALVPKKLFAVKVANGSMESGLHDGDTVIVNTAQKEPRDGYVFAVNYEGQLVIKRMIRDAGEWWLSSDNPDQRRYPRKVCDENTFVIGEIVHKQSERI